jgi:hypothetical protein
MAARIEPSIISELAATDLVFFRNYTRHAIVEIFYLKEPYVGYPAPSSEAHLGLGGGGKSQNKNFEDHIIISTI